MSMGRTILVCALLFGASAAFADNDIREWSGATGGYTIDQELHFIVITAPGTYKFESYHYGRGELANIDQITVAQDCPPGTVNLYISRDPVAVPGDPNQPGVAKLKKVDLRAPNVVGNMQTIRTADDLGEGGPTHATAIAGNLVIGVPGTADGDIVSPLTVERLDGWINCQTLTALTVTDTDSSPGGVHVRGTLTDANGISADGSLGGIWIEGDTNGAIWIEGDVDAIDLDSDVGGYAWVVVNGHTGNLTVLGETAGSMVLNTAGAVMLMDTVPPSQVEVSGDVASYFVVDGSHGGYLSMYGNVPEMEVYGNLTGSIETQQGAGVIGVEYDVTGSIWVWGSDLTGKIEIKGGLSGTVTVSGGLGEEANPITDLSGGYIRVDGSFTSPGFITLGRAIDPNSTAFIAVAYSGWYPGADWGSNDPSDTNNPYVYADPNYYYGNTPARHIWHITECRGDMNNDGIVSYADINGFTLALSQPGLYAVRYPGLGGVAPDPNTGGSRVYHGDMNCDGLLTYADINPFVIRLEEGCCDPNCGACGGNLLQGGGQRLSPQALATRLMLNIDPNLYDFLVEIVAQAATGLDDAGDRAYWQAVYGYLAE